MDKKKVLKMKNGPTRLLTDEQIKVLKDKIKKYATVNAFCTANKLFNSSIPLIILKKRCSDKTYHKILKAK